MARRPPGIPEFSLDATPEERAAYYRKRAKPAKPKPNGRHDTPVPDEAPALDAPEQTSALQRRFALGLDMNSKGMAESNLNNAITIIARDEGIQSIIWYDEFLQKIMTGNPAREWTDADDYNLTQYMQAGLGLVKMNWNTVQKAVITHAFRNTRNCVRDWLETLEWDGIERISHFFIDNYNTEDTEYYRGAGRNFLISMVARVIKPGCKVDTMPVLEGPQGVGKSQSLNILGGDWFTEQHEAVTGKGFYETLQGKWLVEIGELASMNRAEVSKVKQVISCASDRYRVAYGHHAADHPRQCVFVATTNSDDYNRDETGARRLWPIECRGQINIENIKHTRELLFAEALVALKAGETWWEMPGDATKAQQRARYVEDVWQDKIFRWITHQYYENFGWTLRAAPLHAVAISDILQHSLQIPLGQWTRGDQMRVAACLKSQGWTRRQQADGKWLYEKSPALD